MDGDSASLDHHESGERHDLTCAPCGFRTSDVSYMLLHLRECGRQLAAEQAALIKAAMRARARELEGLRHELHHRERELVLLAELISLETQAPRAARRYCITCKKPTSETFGGKPQCAKHRQTSVTNKVVEIHGKRFDNSTTIGPILDEFLKG